MATLALALPAGALADSAGDNQYQDPLANSPQKQKTTQTTTPAPVATPAPATTTAAPSQSSSASATSSSGTLPRTGFPVAPLVILGAALIGAGLIVRRLT